MRQIPWRSLSTPTSICKGDSIRSIAVITFVLACHVAVLIALSLSWSASASFSDSGQATSEGDSLSLDILRAPVIVAIPQKGQPDEPPRDQLVAPSEGNPSLAEALGDGERERAKFTDPAIKLLEIRVQHVLASIRAHPQRLESTELLTSAEQGNREISPMSALDENNLGCAPSVHVETSNLIVDLACTGNPEYERVVAEALTVELNSATDGVSTTPRLCLNESECFNVLVR